LDIKGIPQIYFSQELINPARKLVSETKLKKPKTNIVHESSKKI
jgi:hypothetical protein